MTVHAEKIADRSYNFHAVCGHFVRILKVTIGDADGNISIKTPEDLQKGIDGARQKAAEAAVQAAEHAEIEAQID